MVTVQDWRYKWTCTVSATWELPYNTQKGCYTINTTDQGTYTMECWGASGATMPGATQAGAAYQTDVSPEKLRGGRGAYVKGSIILDANIPLYVYVGQQGTYTTGFLNKTFNGGGASLRSDHNPANDAVTNVHASGSGGGATDVRLIKHTKGTWGVLEGTYNDDYSAYNASRQVDNTSFNSRLIVAAGGGGANNYVSWIGSHQVEYSNGISRTSDQISDSHGGDAGGLIGYSGHKAGSVTTWDLLPYAATAGTQIGAGLDFAGIGYGGDGGFGGGGGGYYGGGGGQSQNSIVSSGAGGSSFIPGHPGCKASVSINSHSYSFSSTKMIDGLGKQWTTSNQTTGGTYVGIPRTSGSGTETGHTGNGYCRIKYTR